MHDVELVSASPEQFRSQMRFVEHHFTPISFRDLAAIIAARMSCPRNPIIVTFDDGYLDNYVNVFPVLRERGIKATFFIVTDFVGTGQSFWFERVAQAIAKAPPGRYFVGVLAGMRSEIVVPSGLAERRTLVKSLLKALKLAPADEAYEWVDHLSRALGASEGVADGESQLFGWQEVSEMHRSGLVEFGSHTKTHPVLSRVDPTRLYDELEGSKKAIRLATGVDCTVLAYPVGGRSAYSPAVIQAVEECGYQFACTNVPGANRLGRLQRFELCRSPVERYTTVPRFRASLAFPDWF
jgi:peptidoglycan/xylan/chitin deacetylase (PgdA/CDA1 family)